MQTTLIFFRRIHYDEDCIKMQEDLKKAHKWSENWLLKFHPKKCVQMRLGNTAARKMIYKMEEKLTESVSENDLGVIFDVGLTFSEHIANKVSKANNLGMIRRTFSVLNEQSFKPLYTALVGAQIEYANQVWAPRKIKDIEDMENFPRRATRMIPGLKILPYEETEKIKPSNPCLPYI